MSEIAARMPMADPAQLRVGDAERYAAASALGEHFAAGRLDQDELDGRLTAAYAARTRADLQRLFVDLPEPAPFRDPPAAPARRHPGQRSGRWPAAAGWLPLVPLVCFVVVLVSVGLVAHRVPPFAFILFFWVFAGWHPRRWQRVRYGYRHDRWVGRDGSPPVR